MDGLSLCTSLRLQFHRGGVGGGRPAVHPDRRPHLDHRPRGRNHQLCARVRALHVHVESKLWRLTQRLDELFALYTLRGNQMISTCRLSALCCTRSLLQPVFLIGYWCEIVLLDIPNMECAKLLYLKKGVFLLFVKTF